MKEEQKMKVKECVKNGEISEILGFVKEIYLGIPQKLVLKVEEDNIS